MVNSKAPVNKIIYFSNVDGPGNRTSVFFQGCSFNCRFCHNPETIKLCINCGACVQTCPVGALSFNEQGEVEWDDRKCVRCDTCLKTCPNSSSPRIKWMTVEDVMKQINRSAPYIDGITTSGGECTLYADFLIELFTEVKKMGKTCLIDSNGSFDFEKDPRILQVSDGVMLDVKAVSEDWHRWLIGRDRGMVLKNLDYLLKVDKLYEVRTLIFPDRDEENEKTVRYVSDIIKDKCFYKIIRYRPFGVRDQQQKELGEFTAEQRYAQKYADLAVSLGATKTYVI